MPFSMIRMGSGIMPRLFPLQMVCIRLTMSLLKESRTTAWPGSATKSL